MDPARGVGMVSAHGASLWLPKGMRALLPDPCDDHGHRGRADRRAVGRKLAEPAEAVRLDALTDEAAVLAAEERLLAGWRGMPLPE
jgi:hypothetical protein